MICGAAASIAFHKEIFSREDQIAAAISIGIAELHTAIGQAGQRVGRAAQHGGAIEIGEHRLIDAGFRKRHHGATGGAAGGAAEARDHNIVDLVAIEICQIHGAIAQTAARADVRQGNRGGGECHTRGALRLQLQTSGLHQLGGQVRHHQLATDPLRAIGPCAPLHSRHGKQIRATQ